MLKIKYFGMILLLVIAVVCVSCGNKNKGSSSADHATEQTKENGKDFHKEDVETFEIDNPICALKYPLRWKDCVKTEMEILSDGCSVTFRAVLEDKDISLFSFILRDASDEGYLLGVLKTKDGDKKVYLMDLFEKGEVDTLSEEAKSVYDEMCYDVNIVISKLVYDSNMTLVG